MRRTSPSTSRRTFTWTTLLSDFHPQSWAPVQSVIYIYIYVNICKEKIDGGWLVKDGVA